MKKNYLFVTIGLVSAITLSACGGGEDTNASDKNNDTEQETTENAESETTSSDESEFEENEEEETDGEWEYQVGDTNEDGSLKLLARNDTSETIETASISLDFPQVTVAEVVEWPADLADYYDFEPTGVIQIDVEVLNSSEETINFYIGQATITTSTGEQLEPDFLSSDHIGGEFIGSVNKSGSVRYMLESSDPNEIEWVRVLVDAPHDENFESVGDDIDVQIDF